MAQAMEIAGLEMAGLTWRDADRLLERIRAVQPEQVREAARRHFSDDSLTVVTLEPLPLERSRPAAPAVPLRHR
jgi:zinc protease